LSGATCFAIGGAGILGIHAPLTHWPPEQGEREAISSWLKWPGNTSMAGSIDAAAAGD